VFDHLEGELSQAAGDLDGAVAAGPAEIALELLALGALVLGLIVQLEARGDCWRERPSTPPIPPGRRAANGT